MEENGKPTLSIIIVNYDTRDVTLDCLQSVYNNASRFTIEVIVIDNGSSDGSADAIPERFPDVRLIRNMGNRYFSPAVNQGLKISRGHYILLLNSDTKVLPGTLDTMINWLEKHPNVGACGGQQLGVPYMPCWHEHRLTDMLLSCEPWAYLRSRFSASVKESGYSWDKPHLEGVEVISDGFILIRARALSDIGTFLDEHILLYFTEDDLSSRLRAAGWTLDCLADAKVVHLWQHTSKRTSPLKIKKIYQTDAIWYARKHLGYVVSILLWLATRIDYALAFLRFRLRSRKKRHPPKRDASANTSKV